MKRSSTPKIVFTCRFRFALNNPDNKFKNNNYKKSLNGDIGRTIGYYKDKEKEVIGMIDYYTGSKQERLVNLILEDGNYATEEQREKLQNQLIKATDNSNLYKGIVSFDNDWITQTIRIRDLEKLIATEVMPKFLKRCGFVDMKKMRCFFSMHGNTKHLHLHLGFAELKPNHINRDGKILYRRLGMITEEEKNYFKNELLIAIERNSVMKPMLIETNKDIDELKTYFNPNDKNFILKDIKDIRLEEKIIKLGFLINEYREDKDGKKVKYGSIKNNELGKEIKKITAEIKKELFYNKGSELYKQQSKVKEDLKKLNNYYDELNKQNHIESKIKNNKLVSSKSDYIDSYIHNAIINHALFRTNKLQNVVKTKNTKDKITLDDLLQELAFEKSKNYKGKNVKLILLKNNFRGKTKSQKYRLNYEITQAVKNLNNEMEDYAKDFHQLFINDDYNKQNY